MSKVNFKQPKYVLPLVILPFLFLINYALAEFSPKDKIVEEISTGNVKSDIGAVSDRIASSSIDTKLEANKKQYNRISDGYSGILNLGVESDNSPSIESQYNEDEKRMLDSIENAVRSKFFPDSQIDEFNTYRPSNQISNEDQELISAINNLQGTSQIPPKKYEDPMDLFRAQMTLIDSMNKANEPQFEANVPVDEEPLIEEEKTIRVSKVASSLPIFNTITANEESSFIKAIVDEDIKNGTLGGRLRIRLLDDIQISDKILKKGTYLYALISGYDAQRVKLSITSVMVDDRIFPINLHVYDNDGLEGLYVPASAFREFSKELGSNSSRMSLQMQQNPDSFSQLYMSALQKMFQSTSQAVSKTIKKNKANVKYGTFLYLVDPQELRDSTIN